METERIRSLIRSALADAEVEVTDMQGGDHFDVVVVSAAFEGRSMVQQHRMVYAALGDCMRSEIHALALRTMTPAEYRGSLIGAIAGDES